MDDVFIEDEIVSLQNAIRTIVNLSKKASRQRRTTTIDSNERIIHTEHDLKEAKESAFKHHDNVLKLLPLAIVQASTDAVHDKSTLPAKYRVFEALKQLRCDPTNKQLIAKVAKAHNNLVNILYGKDGVVVEDEVADEVTIKEELV